jgi:transcriptional antiterminator NusG
MEKQENNEKQEAEQPAEKQQETAEEHAEEQPAEKVQETAEERTEAEEQPVEKVQEAVEEHAEEKVEEAEKEAEEHAEAAEKPAKKQRKKKKAKEPAEEPEPEKKEQDDGKPKIFAIRTTANREEQVADFLAANAEKKGMDIYSVLRPHGMRSYIFVEAINRMEAEQAAFDVPYARGVLPEPVPYEEIEHMVEQVKKEVNIQKNDIVEIISGPFKREQAKVTKVDKEKEEVVVELLEAAVPIPITLKLDALKVIRREE